VDPLLMPIGAMATAGQQVFRLVRRLREELGVNTTCGASNVAFGLPSRHALSAAFLTMAAASGMTSAITNPLSDDVRRAVLAADVLLGHDPDCATWISRNREGGQGATPDGTAGRRRGGREGRRRAAADSGAAPPPTMSQEP
jgi:5-methyltetrahydrofolate--homocysteine methyltransferase